MTEYRFWFRHFNNGEWRHPIELYDAFPNEYMSTGDLCEFIGPKSFAVGDKVYVFEERIWTVFRQLPSRQWLGPP